VLPYESLELDTTTIDPICHGDDNGLIEIVALGDYPPYLYAINEVATPIGLFEGLTAGDYVITITNSIGCEDYVDLTLTNPDLFEINISSDTTIVLGESIDLSVTSNYNVTSLVWDPEDISPCGDCLEFSFVPTSSQLYTATAINAAGCIATDEVQITIDLDDIMIYIPNVFSPTLSGVDNNFTIGAKDGLVKRVIDFSVYDRWGNLIHQVGDATELELWRGRSSSAKKINSGVYVYKLTLELLDGNSYEFIGDFLLMK